MISSHAAPLVERIVEGIGPIVVKEVRQGLRARVFSVFVGALLVACVVVALVAFARARLGHVALGPQSLAINLGGLALVGFFVVPFAAFRSTLRELEDETWVLLTLTGLGARAVVRGKWLSAMCQFVLFASVCAPFVVFSWFLNGVDLPQMLVALGLVCGWSAFSTAVAIAVATQAQSRIGRIVAHFAALGLLGVGSFLGIFLTSVLALEGSRALRETGVPQALFTVFLLSLASTFLALEGAAAGLALPTESASGGPRRALVTVVVGAWLCALMGWRVWAPVQKVAWAGAALNGLYLVAAGFFAVSERDGWHTHVTTRGWRKPGALRSFVLVMGLLAVSPFVWLSLEGLSWNPTDDSVRLALAASAYPALYLSLAVVLGRATALRRLGEPFATRLAFGAATALGVVAPRLLFGRYADRPAVIFSPLEGMERFLMGSMHWEGAVLLLVVTTFFSALALAVLMANDEART